MEYTDVGLEIYETNSGEFDKLSIAFDSDSLMELYLEGELDNFPEKYINSAYTYNLGVF